MSLTRKYSSTAFFSHSCTSQPPAAGVATRALPDSSSAITSSTAGFVEPSISATLSVARRSNASSMIACSWSVAAFFLGILMVSVDAGHDGLAQIVQQGLVADRAVALVGEQEDVLDFLAERGDARVVHAQPAPAQHLGDAGQQ